jgi:hypothetical protein
VTPATLPRCDTGPSADLVSVRIRARRVMLPSPAVQVQCDLSARSVLLTLDPKDGLTPSGSGQVGAGQEPPTRTPSDAELSSSEDRAGPLGSSTSNTPGERLTYFQAALRILETSKQPMTTREIVSKAVGRGLINPRGKTPEATLSALFYLHLRDAPKPLIRRHAKPGPTRAQRGSVAWSLRTEPRKRD